jgi:hypothetical protein
MAKPDWGELQQRFLSDHAATGVSPKDWCEAQGLNYATARRYIKKPLRKLRKNLRRKNAHCAKGKAQKSWWMMMPKIKSAYVAEYLKDNNATQAAIRAGYSEKMTVVSS